MSWYYYTDGTDDARLYADGNCYQVPGLARPDGDGAGDGQDARIDSGAAGPSQDVREAWGEGSSMTVEKKAWYEGVPAPVDADGNVVPLTTRTLYEGDGHEIIVTEYALIYSRHTGGLMWRVRGVNGMIFMLELCHLECPDSWDALTADVERTCRAGGKRPFICEYWGDTAHMPCGGDACTPFGLNEARCIHGALRDILRRIRVLREKERDED